MSEVKQTEFDLAILGAGPGGYVAALQAAKLGAEVALIEKENIGGTCLNWGCIPTKALISSAELYRKTREASSLGVNIDEVSINMAGMIKRKDRVVTKLVRGIEYLLKNEGVTVFQGEGEFVRPGEITVTGDNYCQDIRTKKAIIATGSRASRLPVPGMELPGVIGSREALALEELPEKMVIVGGGVIGMEFAFLFANLDVEVTVIEFLDDILPEMDGDIRKELRRSARRRKINLHTSSEVQKISTTEDEEEKLLVNFVEEDKEKFIPTEMVLVAVGRVPDFTGLDPEALGLDCQESGRGIAVNERMETSVDNVYAIGDVTDKILLAHVAMHQGIVAAKNACGRESSMSYQAVPSAIFTDPEVATVGLSEKEAASRGITVEVGRFPYSANGKVLAAGERQGFVKILQEKESGRVIGGAIVGLHATDLIATLTLAVENNLTAADIGETIFAHPTTAEVIHEAALGLEGGALHYSE